MFDDDVGQASLTVFGAEHAGLEYALKGTLGKSFKGAGIVGIAATAESFREDIRKGVPADKAITEGTASTAASAGVGAGMTALAGAGYIGGVAGGTHWHRSCRRRGLGRRQLLRRRQELDDTVMYSSEINLPPRPNPQTGEPRPPQPPRVLGLSRDSARTTASAGAPPAGRGPALAVHGDEWWSAPVAAVVLSIITAIIFSFESDDWFTDPFSLGLMVLVFAVTLVREWKVKIVTGADWLRVNNKWVDTYTLTRIELRGLWFGWMLRLKDTDGRRVRTYMSDLEANPDLWALAYNGMLHSAHNGAHVNSVAAGILQLKPGFEAMRHQARRAEIPRRTTWTLLLVVVVVFVAIYLLRPDIFGMALAIFAGMAIVLTLGAGMAIAIARRKQNNRGY